MKVGGGCDPVRGELSPGAGRNKRAVQRECWESEFQKTDPRTFVFAVVFALSEKVRAVLGWVV